MIRVRGILLVRQHNRYEADAARDVVHVSVRIVTRASIAEPDGVRAAKVSVEGTLVVDALHPRIAHLRVAEEPLFGDDDASLAVHLDPTALEHEPRARIIRTHRVREREARDVLHGLG